MNGLNEHVEAPEPQRCSPARLREPGPIREATFGQHRSAEPQTVRWMTHPRPPLANQQPTTFDVDCQSHSRSTVPSQLKRTTGSARSARTRSRQPSPMQPQDSPVVRSRSNTPCHRCVASPAMPSRANPSPEPKTCAGCGRRIEWRSKWARNWATIRWCSDACRRHGVRDVDRQLEVAIMQLLEARAVSATICPSEAAREVGGENWRPLMEPARRAARRLVAAERVEITQAGAVVDPSTARGPIRIRRVRI